MYNVYVFCRSNLTKATSTLYNTNHINSYWAKKETLSAKMFTVIKI